MPVLINCVFLLAFYMFLIFTRMGWFTYVTNVLRCTARSIRIMLHNLYSIITLVNVHGFLLLLYMQHVYYRKGKCN